MDQNKIRNFCIIAHIDHGKSTLADRLLELTHTVEQRQMKQQMLDTMELEREKGITIKLQPVRMIYRDQKDEARSTKHAENSNTQTSDSSLHSSTPIDYQLNLIDTPGHVDFSYEVSRSLAACEGAVVLVDGSQGIQAQTLANIYLAAEAGLTLIPVVNKIDLPAADPERVAADLANLLDSSGEDVLRISAKTGQGVEEVLKQVVKKIPSPKGKPNEPLRALVFDSQYDDYRGVVLYVRVVDGELSTNASIDLLGSKATGQALEVGRLSPQLQSMEKLHCGEIGYIVTNFKSVAEARVGDTVTTSGSQPQALPGYRHVKPFVYAGFFPLSNDQHPQLKEALAKLSLNDAALNYSAENSPVLGFGFRIGFLGLLHMDIIKERLEREYNLELIVTNPSTDYEVLTTDGSKQSIHSAAHLPDASKITEIREPWIKGEVIVPKDYVGPAVQLVSSARGRQTGISYLDDKTALINFEAPLANVLTDFYDQLKSVTSGFGSFNYELAEYRTEDLVKLDILIGGERVDSLSQIVHRSEAQSRGIVTVEKLKEVIPRQLFEISLQAAIGGKIIAREDIKALGKNVTAKLYGGDVTRKRKLWEKQKAGKKRMKQIGKAEIPPEAFTVLLKKD